MDIPSSLAEKCGMCKKHVPHCLTENLSLAPEKEKAELFFWDAGKSCYGCLDISPHPEENSPRERVL